MKIGVCKTGGDREQNIVEALKMLDCQVIWFEEECKDYNYDVEYANTLIDWCSQNSIEQVWSMEFLPIVSRGCHVMQIPYISWVTEKQVYTLYSNVVYNKENFIFVAEEIIYEQVKERNPDHIFYMMPGGLIKEKEAEAEVVFHVSAEDRNKYLLSEQCPNYLLGYLRGIIEAQLKIYGYHFVERLLREEIKKAFLDNIQRKGLCSDYEEEPVECLMDDFLCGSMTESEKERLIQEVDADKIVEENADCIGKINVYLADRKWKCGIPFEIFTIMGAGGFVISNYQAGMEEYFEIGTELVIFEDYEDLKRKIEYYKNHTEERETIARNGQRAVAERYLLAERIKDILYILEQVL